MLVENLLMRILRIQQVHDPICQDILDLLRSEPYLARELLTPLHEGNVVQLLTLFDVTFKQVLNNVLANTAHLHAKLITLNFVFARCCDLYLTEDLVPLV